MTRLLLLLLGLLAPATVRAAIVKLAKAAPTFASAAASSAPALVDPVAVPIVSDPVVAAAVVSAAPRAPAAEERRAARVYRVVSLCGRRPYYNTECVCVCDRATRV